MSTIISDFLKVIESADDSDELCLPVLETIVRERLAYMSNDEIHRVRAVVQKKIQRYEKLDNGMYFLTSWLIFPDRQVEIAEIKNMLESYEGQKKKLAPIARAIKHLKISAHFFAENFKGEALPDIIEDLGAIRVLPSFNHVLGCLDEGFDKQHVVGTLSARITEAQQKLNVLQAEKDEAKRKADNWAAVMKSIEHVSHPLSNVTNSQPKRASSESAESETPKKARTDYGVALPSSPENSDYNEKENFHKSFVPVIPVEPTVTSRPTTAGKKPNLRPAHNLVVTHVGAETGAAAGARPTGLGGRELEAAVAVEVATESNAAEVLETKQARIEEGVCRVCKLGDRDVVLLMCGKGKKEYDDGCDDMYHTTCVGLTDVPPENWYCHICQEIQDSRPPVPAIQPAQPGSSVALAEEPAGDDSSKADELNASVLEASIIYLSD
jgi:hypothetical protein